MVGEKLQRALRWDVPNYHQRQAAHFRALAETAATPAIKARLLREAERNTSGLWTGPSSGRPR